MKKERRNVYLIDTDRSNIQKINFRYLSSGDLFYLEEDNSELVTNFDGKFIWCAVGEPYLNSKGNWELEVESI